MLEALRSFVGSWVAKILLVLLVASFAVWGVADSGLNSGSGTSVATVGETDVSVYDYLAVYNRNLSQMSQQFGRRLTQEQARTLGVESRTIADIVTSATLDEYARTLDMALSEDQLAQMIAENPAFHGSDGKFSRSRFEHSVRQAGLREADFIRLQNGNAVRSQVMAGIADGILLPKAFENAFSAYATEQRKFAFLELTAAQIEPIQEPTDGELNTYFEANTKTYAAPEFRKFAILALEPKDIADEASVSDEEVKADYESRIDAYRTPEKRRVQQLVLSKEKADKATADMASGSTFETIVSDNGKKMTDVDLGTIEKSALPKALQDIAFGLKLNEPSAPLEGPFGQTILRVIEIENESTRDLSEVSDEIRKDLALRRAADQVVNLQTEIEDIRAGGTSLQEAADQVNLKVRIVEAIDATSRDERGNVISDLPSSRQLLNEVFRTEIDEQTSPLELNTIGSLWYDVLEITDARDRKLEEVKDKVTADWKLSEQTKKVTEKAEKLKIRLTNGASLQEIATELELQTKETAFLQRNGEETGFSRGAVLAGFSGSPKSVAIADAEKAGNKLLIQVKEFKRPKAEIEAATSQAVEREIALAQQGAANDLLQQLVEELQSKFDVALNRDLMRQALVRQ